MVTMPSGCPANGSRGSAPRPPAASSAVTARSDARPNSAIRRRPTSARAAGPRSPEAWSSTAGRPSRLTSPCSLTVSGTALRIHCALAREPPGSRPVSCRIATSTVRRQRSGGCSRPLDHGTTQGLAVTREARSPSTSTASILAGSAVRAHSRAPAAPPLPPEVETSTSVLRRSRPIRRGLPGSAVGASPLGSRVRKIRASSSSAAVPDNSARPGVESASRCARSTIRRSDTPGRTPTTVSSVRSPSTVAPSARVRSTAKPAARSPRATRRASAASPGEPGRRRGKLSPSSNSEPRTDGAPNARAGSNASAIVRVRSADGRPCSANATTNSAIRAGTKAAR